MGTPALRFPSAGLSQRERPCPGTLEGTGAPRPAPKTQPELASLSGGNHRRSCEPVALVREGGGEAIGTGCGLWLKAAAETSRDWPIDGMRAIWYLRRGPGYDRAAPSPLRNISGPDTLIPTLQRMVDPKTPRVTCAPPPGPRPFRKPASLPLHFPTSSHI